MTLKTQSVLWRLFAYSLILTLVGFVASVRAQTLTFTAETTSGAGSVVPVLTWSTSPGATSCTASGDWTGTKAASGTQTLAAITASRTYNLVCSWPAGSTATLSWTAPTTNTDGSTYTDRNGYVIAYGNSASVLSQSKIIASSTATTDTITGLTAGTWFFGIRARNQSGTLSDLSNVVSKTLAAGTQTRTVGITVNPKPSAPTGLTVE